jgi:hypothetical protein
LRWISLLFTDFLNFLSIENGQLLLDSLPVSSKETARNGTKANWGDSWQEEHFGFEIISQPDF